MYVRKTFSTILKTFILLFSTNTMKESQGCGNKISFLINVKTLTTIFIKQVSK